MTRRFKVMAALAAAAAAGLALVPFRFARSGPVTFNQHMIEDVWTEAGAFTAAERGRALLSAYRDGWRRMLAAAPDAGNVEFNDPASVLAYLFEQLPPYAIVYPTETYYYYRFPLKDRVVSGNLRLLDAGSGTLHIGYFDVDDRGAMNAASFGAEQGVEIRPLSEHAYRVTYRGRSVVFELATRALDVPESLRLLSYEEPVSGILDESGVALSLLYNNVTEAFYYVLNEEIPVCDRLVPVEVDPRLLVGERTRFVFFHDKEFDRKLLVGVLAKSIYENNYYDGPFDQVPPRLPIKQKLEAAYPYVTLRGGIDEHGNFTQLEHQRVAISPYVEYADLTTLAATLAPRFAESLVKAELWSSLTYESKRDFHRIAVPAATVPSPTGSEAAPLPIYVAQGWPANHWGDVSGRWAPEHRATLSSTWPANHEHTVSSAGDQSSEARAERDGASGVN